MASPQNICQAKGYIGGGADDLDNIKSTGDDAIGHGDICIVIIDKSTYTIHEYDSTSAAAESSPNVVIPDDNVSGTGAWLLVESTGLPENYLTGLILSNDAGDTDHDINITAGRCRDSGNSEDMVLASETTKQIDAAFAAGDDAGGMFTGSVAADTWYHVFLIRKDSDGTIDAGFDTSITAANIPSGYTEYRRIGSVLTDGSSNIYPFLQIGDYFLWTSDVTDFTTDVLTNAATQFAIRVPLGLRIQATLYVYGGRAASIGNIVVRSPDEADAASSDANATLSWETAGNWVHATFEVWTDTSSQIEARGEYATANKLRGRTIGWVDTRGKL